MASSQLVSVFRHIHRLGGSEACRSQADRQLLRQFADQHDQAAFTELVRRHGRLVWGVCRHVLGHDQDAEDAFQATFLALALKAGALCKLNTLAGWLHGAAFRSALQIKRQSARRRRHEQQAGSMPREKAHSDLAWRELQAILDEELQCLPEKCRAPFVLCCLEGRSKAEAARLLGWKEGTLSGRLAQARKLLQQRLSRRGVSLSAVLCAAGLVTHTAQAAPAALVQMTIQAALAVSAGHSALAGVVSAEIAAAVKAVTNTLVLTKYKIATVLLVAMAALAGAGALAQRASTAPQPGEEPEQFARAEQAAKKEPKTEAPPPVRLDRYGDALPPGAITRFGTTRFRHGDSVTSIAFSPDGKTLASGSYGRTICLWDAVSGRELRRFEAHPEWVMSLAFSPDGKVLASAGGRADGAIRLHDAATGKELRRLKGHQDLVHSVAFSPDGKTLASGGWDKTVRLWDLTTGAERRSLEQPGRVQSVAFSPDGKTLASVGEDPTIRLWDVATGRKLRRFGSHKGGVPAVAFSADGKTLVSGSGFGDHTIRLWEVASGKELRQLKGHEHRVDCVAFSPDGKTVASGSSDKTIRFWDAGTGTEVRRIRAHQHFVATIAFSPDGKKLASGSADATIGLWDVATGRDLRPPGGHEGAVNSVAFFPDGKTLVSASWDKTMRVWEVSTAKELRRFVGHQDAVFRLALSSDGATVASASFDQTVRVWNVAEGKESHKLEGHQGYVNGVALSPDGRLLASAGDDSTLRLWEVPTGKARPPLQHPTEVLAVAFAPDGKLLASACRDRMIRLWDVATGRELRRFVGNVGWSYAIVFSPDGRTLATGGQDSATRLLEVATGKERRQFGDPKAWAGSLAFSADGKTLVTGGFDKTIRFWEVATGKERHRLTGARGWLRSVAFSPDQKTLASGSEDSTVLLWDVRDLGRDTQSRPLQLSAKELEALWTDLGSEDAPRGYRAICSLRAGTQALAFFRERLRPAPPADSGRVARLIADLDDERFAVREKATTELEKLGKEIEPALHKALQGKPSLEVRRRIDRLLEKLESAAPSPEQLRLLRALEVLEHIGTPEARELLRTLAKGASGARLTQEAKASLDRLANRAVAGR